MTNEEIIEAAREAGMAMSETDSRLDYLQRFAALIEAKTLERAAKICNDIFDDPQGNDGYECYYTRPYLECAAAIREMKK